MSNSRGIANLLSAAEQLQKQQKQKEKRYPIAKRVVLIPIDPRVDRSLYRDVIRQNAGVPLYTMSASMTSKGVSDYLRVSLKEMDRIIKGHFNDDNVRSIKARIYAIEKTPQKDIEIIHPGQQSSRSRQTSGSKA